MTHAATATYAGTSLFKQAATTKAVTPVLPAGAHMAHVSSLAGLARIAADWIELEQSAVGSVFQSFAWVSQWCAANIAKGSTNELLIVTGYHFNKLVFVWPLMKNHSHGLRTAEWLTSPSGQYGDVILADGYDCDQWHNAAVNMLRNSGEIDILRLRHVRHGSKFHAFAIRNMVGAQNPERAPYMDLTLYASAEEYEARYTSTQRKRRKKIRKELETFGDVSFTRLQGGTETDRAIDMALDHKIAWLTERGRVNRVLHCPAHRDFLKGLARTNTAIVSEITVGGKAISWEIGFRFGGTHFAYITSHDNAMTDYSPGRLHMHHSQLLCLADGLKRFDLMIPHDAHKESWATGMVSTDDYFLPLSWRGSLQGYGYLKSIRPLLRKAYYKMPKSVLAALRPITSMC
jgi:CelD/BcsL family acetyltransferase involved in cellulose biosynthesis